MQTRGNKRKSSKRGVTRSKKEIEIREGDLTTMTGRFVAARKAVGLSPAKLAEQLDISRSAVSRIEQGYTKTLRSDTLMGMELVTHHRATWIAEGTGQRFVSEQPDELAARQAVFTMSTDQLRDSVLSVVDDFTKDDMRVIIDAFLDRLQTK